MLSLPEQGSNVPIHTKHHSRIVTYTMPEHISYLLGPRGCRDIPEGLAITRTPKHAPLDTKDNRKGTNVICRASALWQQPMRVLIGPPTHLCDPLTHRHDRRTWGIHQASKQEHHTRAHHLPTKAHAIFAVIGTILTNPSFGHIFPTPATFPAVHRRPVQGERHRPWC